MKIVIATHNSDKCREILSEANSPGISLTTLDEFPEIGDIEETGTTLDENALIKAKTVHAITGLPTIADDTGLEVDALNGAPGVYSARFAGENCTYKDNVVKLLQEMENIPEIQRSAKFTTVMVYINDQVELMAKGAVKGVITTEPKGFGGFGYDPVFYVPELQRTFAEITMNEKSKISHRGKAVRNLFKLLTANSVIPSTNTPVGDREESA